MFNSIVTWLSDLIVKAGPIGVAIVTAVESFFAPIPSQPILILTGTTLNTPMDVFIYAVFATIGTYIGTFPYYFIAYKSKKLLNKFIDKYGRLLCIDNKDMQRAEDKFQKHGKPIIFFGRLIPGIRSLISIPAGLARIDFKTYSIFTLAGALVGNSIPLTLGFLFKKQCLQIIDLIDQYENFVYIILACILLYLVSKHILKNIRKQK